MQRISEVMTRNVRFVSPRESLQRAAQVMDELNVGSLPVCDGERLVGMVTDRDITVRGTAAGKAAQDAHVDEVMSSDVRWCFEDQSLDEVMQKMANTQIRRVPVVSHDDARRLIGIVALGDLATKSSGGDRKQDVEQTVEAVSSPSEPDRAQQAGSGTRAGQGVSARTGSDTGTATGLAGSDTLDAMGETDNGPATGPNAKRTTGAAGGTGARGVGGTATAGGTGTATAGAAPDARTGTGGTTQNTGRTGAPDGTDATGIGGASGGTAGAAGAGGTGVGSKP